MPRSFLVYFKVCWLLSHKPTCIRMLTAFRGGWYSLTKEWLLTPLRWEVRLNPLTTHAAGGWSQYARTWFQGVLQTLKRLIFQVDIKASPKGGTSHPTPPPTYRIGVKRDTVRWAQPAQLATWFAYSTLWGLAYTHTPEPWVLGGSALPRGTSPWAVSTHGYAAMGGSKVGTSGNLNGGQTSFTPNPEGWVSAVEPWVYVWPHPTLSGFQPLNERGYFFPQTWLRSTHRFQRQPTPLGVYRFTTTPTSARSFGALWASRLSSVQSRHVETFRTGQPRGARYGFTLSPRGGLYGGLNLPTRRVRYVRAASYLGRGGSTFVSKLTRLQRLVTLGPSTSPLGRYSFPNSSKALALTNLRAHGMRLDSLSHGVRVGTHSRHFNLRADSIVQKLRFQLLQLQSVRLDFDFRTLSGRFKQPCVKYRPGFFTYWRQYRWQLHQHVPASGGFRQHALSRFVARTRRVSTFSFFYAFTFTPHKVYRHSHLRDLDQRETLVVRQGGVVGFTPTCIVNGVPVQNNLSQLYVGDVVFFLFPSVGGLAASEAGITQAHTWGASYLPEADLTTFVSNQDTPYYLEVDELSQSVVILVQPVGSNPVGSFGGVELFAHASYKLYNWKYLT